MAEARKWKYKEENADARARRSERDRNRYADSEARERRSERSRKYYAKTKERHKETARRSKLKRLYGISADRYLEILERQNHACVCGRTAAEQGKRLAVDHDHHTGKVRGLLCNNCNIAVGFCEDDPARLERLAAYLRGHQEK